MSIAPRHRSTQAICRPEKSPIGQQSHFFIISFGVKFYYNFNISFPVLTSAFSDVIAVMHQRGMPGINEESPLLHDEESQNGTNDAKRVRTSLGTFKPCTDK